MVPEEDPGPQEREIISLHPLQAGELVPILISLIRVEGPHIGGHNPKSLSPSRPIGQVHSNGPDGAEIPNPKPPE